MQRIYLRPLITDDIDERYLNGFKNESVLSFLEVEGKTLTKQIVVDYMKEGISTKTYFMYAICLKDNDLQIGNLKVGKINLKHMFSDLVTVIWDQNYWGKGLATESIKLGNKIAFEKHNIRKLTGGMYASNIGSYKAYTNAGWFKEGVLKNHLFDGKKFQDQILISCFNPFYFSKGKN